MMDEIGRAERYTNSLRLNTRGAEALKEKC